MSGASGNRFAARTCSKGLKTGPCCSVQAIPPEQTRVLAMPIRIRLDRLLVARRMSLSELADRVGVTQANLAILKTGEARAIWFATLAALCRELDCEPGDILVYEPGSPGDGEGL